MLWTLIGVLAFALIAIISLKVGPPVNFIGTGVGLMALVGLWFVPNTTDAYDEYVEIRNEYKELCSEVTASNGVNDGISKTLLNRITTHNERAKSGCGSDFWESEFTGFGYHADNYVIDTTKLTVLEKTTTATDEQAPPTTTIIDGNVYVLQETTEPVTIIQDGKVYVRQEQ